MNVTEELREHARNLYDDATAERRRNHVDWGKYSYLMDEAAKLEDMANQIDWDVESGYKAKGAKGEGPLCPMTFSDPCGDRDEECRGEDCAWYISEECAVALLAMNRQ